MAYLKGGAAALTIGLLIVFMLQNRESLTLQLLGWEFQTRRAYMLLTFFGSGLAIGWIAATISGLAARSREASTRASERAAR